MSAITTRYLREAIDVAERQVAELSLGNGSRRTNIVRALDAMSAYLREQEVTLGKLLEATTLRDGIAIQAALDSAHVEGAILQLAPAEGDTPARYRVEATELGALEGTVGQLTAMLAKMRAG